MSPAQVSPHVVSSEDVPKRDIYPKFSSCQVCSSWLIQRSIPAVPKSVQEVHMKENLQLEKLPDEDFEALQKLWLERGPIRFLDPSRHIGFDIFDEEKDEPLADKAPWD